MIFRGEGEEGEKNRFAELVGNPVLENTWNYRRILGKDNG